MADLCLPYPNGPRVTDTPSETRRKIAENLDAIADWVRRQGETVRQEGVDLVAFEMRDGAIAIDQFEDAVR